MIEIPSNVIAIVPLSKSFSKEYQKVLKSLSNNIKRDWFVKHAYYCLPLTIGNQSGFVVKSLYDFTVVWNGGQKPLDVTVEMHDPDEYNKWKNLQKLEPHFGMGTVTIQHGFSIRTPKGINIMTGNPPNYYIDGITNMTGVVETDNLRRDFTFNFKITRPNFEIKICKGDWIGYFIPYPRHFVDHFSLTDAYDIFTDELIEEEIQCGRDFGKERSGPDRQKLGGNGRRYWNGEDIYGNKFPDHQKRLKPY